MSSFYLSNNKELRHNYIRKIYYSIENKFSITIFFIHLNISYWEIVVNSFDSFFFVWFLQSTNLFLISTHKLWKKSLYKISFDTLIFRRFFLFYLSIYYIDSGNSDLKLPSPYQAWFLGHKFLTKTFEQQIFWLAKSFML